MDRGVDEAAADAARARYRSQGLPTLPPDERVAPLLGPGERIVAVHHSALVDRREPAACAQRPAGPAGTLYVTSARLLLVDRSTVAFELDAIEEAVLARGRLLLLLRDGHGVTVRVAEPRLLRVEIAAARAAARRVTPPPVRSGAPQPASR